MLRRITAYVIAVAVMVVFGSAALQRRDQLQDPNRSRRCNPRVLLGDHRLHAALF